MCFSCFLLGYVVLFFYRWMQCRAAFLQSTLSRTRRGTRPAWTTTTRPSCWWTMAVLDAEEERRASGPNWRTTSPTSAQASGVRTLLQVLALVSELTSSVFWFVCQEMQLFMIMHHSGKESHPKPVSLLLVLTYSRVPPCWSVFDNACLWAAPCYCMSLQEFETWPCNVQ